MSEGSSERWLEWAREIQALAQTGLHYAENDYEVGRYRRLTEIAAEMVSKSSQLPYDTIIRIFNSQDGYATPRVDVRGAMFHEGKLLMVRERLDGGWTMPGGWADVGDAPSEAVEREVLEEAGLRVKARKIIGIYDANRVGPLQLFHAFKVVFLCDRIGGKPRTGNETSEVSFFSADTVPINLSAERTRPRHIADAFAALMDPDCPTVFD